MQIIGIYQYVFNLSTLVNALGVKQGLRIFSENMNCHKSFPQFPQITFCMFSVRQPD